ncbi:hypothetical protein WN51_12150 [Melipona quadrifasciata]|uniref:Uncharacterized protein n=1 Tax=Melipona quadrifasciata TaxID=166423 RepID=A0A0M9A5U7_9HYME|nr:hypothetical protein WN51_12150 [Melipona quadrifasciata]
MATKCRTKGVGGQYSPADEYPELSYRSVVYATLFPMERGSSNFCVEVDPGRSGIRTESAQRALLDPVQLPDKEENAKEKRRGSRYIGTKMAYNTLENYLTRINVAHSRCELLHTGRIRSFVANKLLFALDIPQEGKGEDSHGQTDRQGPRIPYAVMCARILYAQLSGHKFSSERPLCNTLDEPDGTQGMENICLRGEANICRPSQIIPASFTDRKLGTSTGVTTDYFQLKTRSIGQECNFKKSMTDNGRHGDVTGTIPPYFRQISETVFDNRENLNGGRWKQWLGSLTMQSVCGVRMYSTLEDEEIQIAKGSLCGGFREGRAFDERSLKILVTSSTLLTFYGPSHVTRDSMDPKDSKKKLQPTKASSKREESRNNVPGEVGKNGCWLLWRTSMHTEYSKKHN